VNIVGRDDELAHIEDVLDRARSEPARVVVVGEPGIGKTAVWEAGVAAAAERGFRVLSARPTRSESSLAYAGLADLLAGVEDDAFASLPAPQRIALDVALLRTVDDQQADPRAVFAGFGGVVKSLAVQQPVVVAVDDLQWLDGPTARALEFVGRRLRDEPVALIAAARAEAAVPHDNASWLDDRDRLRLHPLSAGALHELIKQRLGVAVPRPTLLRLHRACGGNAFFALEIARALIEQDALDAGDTWPLADDIRRLVDARLAALPDPERAALLLAAAGATDVHARDVVSAEQAGLVRADRERGIRFVHPLYASAVYLGATPADRRRAHAQLAARADALERAHHLALATEHPDAAIAAELDEASALAVARGAPEIAAELAERAAELTPVEAPDDAAERTLNAAALYLHGGAPAKAARMLSGFVEAEGNPYRARSLQLLSQARFREENFVDALRLLHDAVDDPHASVALRASVELDLALIGTAISYDHGPALAHAVAAVEHAEQSADTGLLASALAVKTLVEFLLGKGVDEAQLARSLELEPEVRRGPVEAHPTLIDGALALYTGRIERAAAVLHPLRQEMLDRGEEAELPLLSIHLAWLELVCGRTDAARAFSDEGIALASLAGSFTAHALAFSALLHAYTGEPERCHERSAAALAAMGKAEFCLVIDWVAWARGALAISQGDFETADSALEPHTREFEHVDNVEPTHLTFLPDKVEALVALGDLERAERLTELLGTMGERFGRAPTRAAADRCRAAILAAQGKLAEADAACKAALARLEHAPVPLEVARTLFLLGQVERRRKQRARSRATLERSLAICERVDARAWAARVRGELERLGGRRAPGELTASELRVAGLAASGLTNREIAATAFMSQKTVEANLSRVYRKLGIRSRAQIALKLPDHSVL
jgi:DNA-binding CsgD family transcriptional regulator